MLELWQEQSPADFSTIPEEAQGGVADAIIANQGVHADTELLPAGRRC
jgi:hypothetical protein